MIVAVSDLTVGEVAALPELARYAVLRALGWVLVGNGWRWVGRAAVWS